MVSDSDASLGKGLGSGGREAQLVSATPAGSQESRAQIRAHRGGHFAPGLRLSVRYGFGCMFCRRVGGLGGFLASPEGIDLSYQPSADRSYPLFPGPQVRVLLSQLGELPGGVALVRALALAAWVWRLVGLPFHFRDFHLQPLAPGAPPRTLPARTLECY